MVLKALEQKCQELKLKMTDQRRVVAQVLSESQDHPDVETLYRRANAIDAKISIATVYRTVKLLEEAGVIERHDFGDGKSRYEETTDEHHDHLIDMRTGKVIEFTNHEIERLQEVIARELGYQLVGHRLELYGIALQKSLDQ
jgi:Fur family transcriptional regulator, ferric uptake regulator